MLADAVLDGLGSDNGVASLMEAGRLKLEGWVEGAGGTAILVREEWLSHS